MDLNLYIRVLRRHRRLVVTGAVLAFALTFLTLFRVSPDGIGYRDSEVWQSESRLLLTRSGESGRTILPSTATSDVDPGRLTDLYAQLANSDEVRGRMRRAGAPKIWKIVAAPVIPQLAGSTLPVISLAGQAPSAKSAVAAAALGTTAFNAYVTSLQQDEAIPAAQRIHIQVLARSATPRPVLIKPRSKTLPIMVLLAVLSATVGLVLILENRSPRMQVLESAAADDDEDDLTSPAVHDVRRWG